MEIGKKLFSHNLKVDEEIKAEENVEVLMRFFKRRFDRNKTSTIAISGSLGSGKSYSSLRIAELWYKYFFNENFPIKHVCFSVKEIMDLFNSDKLRKGDMLILEETGIQISNKSFQSKINRFFNYYMQAFRSKQVLIIFNLPVFFLMDKATRILINANFITQAINQKQKLCEIKALFLQLNQQTGKIYPKYLRRRIEKEGYIYKEKIKRFHFSLPSQDLIKEYEKKKNIFLIELGKEVYEEVDKARRKHKPLTEFQQELYDYVKEHPGLRHKDYAEHFKTNRQKITANAGFIQRKGLNIRDFLRK